MSSKYWTDPMNWIGGCSPCAVGCAHCWAADCASKRLANHPLYKGLTKNGKWTGEIRVMPEYIKIIGGKPKTIFWCNMADMFHGKIKFEDTDKAFAAMALMPQHTHLVLTKRVGRMAGYMQGRDWGEACNKILRKNMYLQNEIIPPLPNVHLGVTVCTQKEADEILPIALQIPGFDWISFEPLLASVDFVDGIKYPDGSDWWNGFLMDTNKGIADFLRGVVVGCESGPKKRPCKLEHIRSIVEQCKVAGVGCYVKQIPIYGGLGGKYKHKVSHDPAEWPEDLRVRETI